MSFVPVPAVQQLGVVLGFGVAVSLLLAMTLTPILFSLMNAPEPHTYDASWTQRLLGRSLFGVEQYISRRPWRMVALFAVVCVCSVIGTIRMTIDFDFTERFDEKRW